jgi:hypothetical protein
MKIIADTNVWYYLSNKNNKKLNNLLKKVGTLCSTPISFLEIVSKINEGNFEKRKGVAEALIEKSQEYLPNSEIFLKQSWGFDCHDELDWKQGYGILAEAQNYQGLINGYVDLEDLMVKKLNIPLAKLWRDYKYNQFYYDIAKAINTLIPNYIKKINSAGKIPKIKDATKLSLFNEQNFIDTIIKTTWHRLTLYNGNTPEIKGKLTDGKFQKAKHKLSPYAKAYAEYLKYLCEFGAKPEGNDAGDLECFLYLRDKDYIIATAETRWIKIGNKACPGQILDIKSFIKDSTSMF